MKNITEPIYVTIKINGGSGDYELALVDNNTGYVATVEVKEPLFHSIDMYFGEKLTIAQSEK